MRKIEPMSVDDPNYFGVMAEAEIAIRAANDGSGVIADCYHESVLLALVTWKKIAEERQETIDYLHDVETEASEMYFGNKED